MTIEIESIDDFNDACQEIDILLTYSKKNTSNVRKYATFNKAAIVLLCAKFETFMESFLAEYAYHHLLNSSNHTLDRTIYNHVVDCIINSIEINKNKPDKRQDSISKLAALCGTTSIEPLINYDVDAKLRLGKHGQGEVERLLKVFGFNEYSNQEKAKKFYLSFNSLNNIRNNIVHEDATPSLTHQNVKKYVDSVKEFVYDLTELGVTKLQTLREEERVDIL